MAWFYLLLAGLFEIGWPVGLKLAQQSEYRIQGLSIAVIFMTVSGALLWLAQRDIPIGTSYAIWTAIGASGTFIVGGIFFSDPVSFIRYLGMAFIIMGVALLKLGS